MTCPSEGVLSLLTLAPGSQVADWPGDPSEPVMVHLTACKVHVRAARRWLQSRSLQDVDTFGTEMLMERWGQVREMAGPLPILRLGVA